MIEFLIEVDGDERVIYGFSLSDACRKFEVDINKIFLLDQSYID